MVDDHIWYTIVRGYGRRDQLCDIFATLCNYVKIDALVDSVCTKDKDSCEAFTFVRLNKVWHIFDPDNGTYFKDKTGQIADLKQLKDGNFEVYGLDMKKTQRVDYIGYFQNLPSDVKSSLKRSNIQFPLKRTIFEIKKWIQKK